MRIILLFCFAILFSSCSSHQGDLYRSTVDCEVGKKIHPLLVQSETGIGIQMHTHQTDKVYVDLINEIRPEFIRQDWFSNQGTAHHDFFVDLASGIDATLIFIVKGENDMNDEFDSEILKYEVSRYTDKKVIWELENEPDGFMSVDEYFDWAKDVSFKIRKMNSNACIIGPANKGISDSQGKYIWLKELIDRGYHRYVDGISVHSYYNDPKNSVKDHARLNNLLCPTGLPFLVSEGGPAQKGEMSDYVLYMNEMTDIVRRSGGSVFVWYAMEGDANAALFENGVRTDFSYQFQKYIEMKRKSNI